MPIQQITALQLRDKLNAEEFFLLLDVREPHEFAYAKIAGSISIPLQQIPARITEIDLGKKIVVVCHHGMRSQRAAEYLESLGAQDILNLVGGIDAWSKDCDVGVLRY